MTVLQALVGGLGIGFVAGILTIAVAMIRDVKWERDKNKRLQRLNANQGKTITHLQEETERQREQIALMREETLRDVLVNGEEERTKQIAIITEKLVVLTAATHREYGTIHSLENRLKDLTSVSVDVVGQCMSIRSPGDGHMFEEVTAYRDELKQTMASFNDQTEIITDEMCERERIVQRLTTLLNENGGAE